MAAMRQPNKARRGEVSVDPRQVHRGEDRRRRHLGTALRKHRVLEWSNGSAQEAGAGPAQECPAGLTRPESPAYPGASEISDPVGALGGVVATLDALTATAWHDVSGQGAHDALDLLEQAARRLAAVRTEVLNVVDGNGLWTSQGSRTFPAWLRARTGSTAGAASRQVRESRALRDHLPLTREALAAGTISTDHAGVLVREAARTKELRTQLAHPEVGEAFLVAQAAVMDAGTFTRLVRAWAAAADPQGADRAWREADAKEELTISPTLGGYHVKGWLDEVSGQLVNTALKAHAGRKGADDTRTPAQRRAAALVSLARQSLDTGVQGAGARIRPHVTVTVSLELLRALVAATGSALPPEGPDGRPYPPGAAFGLPAQAALDAPGGPRDQSGGSGEEQGGLLFELSSESRELLAEWRPGDPHVISTAIDHELLRGIDPATLEDGTPIPPALLARLACESMLSRVIFGPESTILDAGREKRIFPANQVRAIIARDKHCQWPGCDEPPGFGEIHHSLWWAKHLGATDAELGVLVCWHHHDWIHAREVTITRSAGRWWFYDRHGKLITANQLDP